MSGGVDTHRDTHVGALVDTAGRLLGSAQFRSDPAGYPQLVAWMQSRGQVARVGWKEPAAAAHPNRVGQRYLRIPRNLPQPATTPHRPRAALPDRIRENPPRQQPNRRATDPSELTPQNPVTITDSGQPGRFISPKCPKKRGNSNPLAHAGVGKLQSNGCPPSQSSCGLDCGTDSPNMLLTWDFARSQNPVPARACGFESHSRYRVTNRFRTLLIAL